MFPSIFLQGLSEQAVNAFRVMRGDGLKPSNLALNSLINAFGEDRRDAEAFAVLQYMKENASCSLLFLYSSLPFPLSYLLLPSYIMSIWQFLTTGPEAGCSYIHNTYESSNSCGEIWWGISITFLFFVVTSSEDSQLLRYFCLIFGHPIFAGSTSSIKEWKIWFLP